MSSRHRYTSSRSLRGITCAAASVVVAAAVTACTTTTKPEPSQPARTVQDFCAPLLDYFRSDFPIDGVTLSYQSATADQSVKDLKSGVTCNFSSKTNLNLSADVTLRPTRADESDGGFTPYLEQMSFVPLPGHEKPIWIVDSRIKKGPIQTKGTVELATRIDPWVSTMEIRNEQASLAISDAQIGKAADTLIQAIEGLGK